MGYPISAIGEIVGPDGKGGLVRMLAVKVDQNTWTLEELGKSFVWSTDGVNWQECNLSSTVVNRDLVASLDRLSVLLEGLLAGAKAKPKAQAAKAAK